MSLKPIRDQLVIALEESTQTTASGLYIAHVEEKHVRGTVLAVGSGRVALDGTRIPSEVKRGDRVVFNKAMATEVKEEGKTFLVLREEHIICVIKA
jgi:chaperonin GroES